MSTIGPGAPSGCLLDAGYSGLAPSVDIEVTRR